MASFHALGAGADECFQYELVDVSGFHYPVSAHLDSKVPPRIHSAGLEWALTSIAALRIHSRQ